MPIDTFAILPDPSNLSRGRKLAYREWGNPLNERVIVCVHGLSRNGRDFDRLASRLSERYRVLCPDMAGRGESDWLQDKQSYNYGTYLSDIYTLLLYMNINSVDWIGTSMGGIIGMTVAAQTPALIKRLVINDIGAIVSSEGLKRILSFVGVKSEYANKAEAMAALQFYLAPFGIQNDADWEFMFSISFKEQQSGNYRFNYDPGITVTFRESAMKAGEISDVNLTPLWHGVQCPALILRGQLSDILSHEVATSMLDRTAPTKMVEFPGVGHAPALLTDDQINVITEWLA